MGLDAIVPCNCFEKGKLSDPPEPFAADDLYRDADGFISSRKLDAELERLGSRAFQNCCGYLEDLLEDWSNNACEHEYGEYFSERVGAWTSVHTFNYIVERLGGSERYPILSTLPPKRTVVPSQQVARRKPFAKSTTSSRCSATSNSTRSSAAIPTNQLNCVRTTRQRAS